MTLTRWVVVFALAACGGSPGILGTTSSTAPRGSTALEGLPEIDPLDVTGDVITAGSSTVFPLTEAVAARFQTDGYDGEITIDSIGTGGGFERFCVDGDTDVANASRPVKAEEVEACGVIGREPVEFRVATDALAVVVGPENYFVEGLTLDELARAFSTARTWTEVNPAFPPHPVGRFSPGTDSGTFDYFVETVFEKDQAPLLNSAGLQLSEDDNVLVQGIGGDGCTPDDLSSSCALGYFGYAYYAENAGRVKAVTIEGVDPSGASVGDGSYPLARPLFIYSDPQVMKARSAVASFIAYYLAVSDEEAGRVGYFPAPPEALAAAVRAWLVATS